MSPLSGMMGSNRSASPRDSPVPPPAANRTSASASVSESEEDSPNSNSPLVKNFQNKQGKIGGKFRAYLFPSSLPSSPLAVLLVLLAVSLCVSVCVELTWLGRFSTRWVGR